LEADQQQSIWLQTVKTVGGAAGVLLPIVTLVFLLFPRLKPEEQPQEQSVHLADLKVRLQEAGDEAVVVYFRVQIEGYQDVPLRVIWTLFDVETGKEMADWPLSKPQLGGYVSRHEGPQFIAKARRASLPGEIRVPGRPPKGYDRTCKVRLEIVNSGQQRLDTPAETEAFSVAERYADPTLSWRP
jgi:hypothetical protein